MNYWLVKFAPFRYSWQDVLRNGKFEIYSVRNFQARNSLKAMKLGDKVFFYHSQEDNCIMGEMIVIEEAHQDKTTENANWVSVTFEPTMSFDKPISLKMIKDSEGLENIALIRQPRLAVMSLTQEQYDTINNIK